MEFNVTKMRILNFFKVRLNKKSVELRKNWNDFVFNPKSPNRGLELFESQMVNNYLMTSQSLSNYVCGNKPSKNRNIIVWIIHLIFLDQLCQISIDIHNQR